MWKAIITLMCSSALFWGQSLFAQSVIIQNKLNDPIVISENLNVNFVNVDIPRASAKIAAGDEKVFTIYRNDSVAMFQLMVKVMLAGESKSFQLVCLPGISIAEGHHFIAQPGLIETKSTQGLYACDVYTNAEFKVVIRPANVHAGGY